MSMLADHKRKPSWVLNPRASEWSKDQNKLGQKMLEKMGWSAGKGLGAKEQGPVEALRIAYKGDAKGLGAQRKKEQQFWLQQQENFQSLLQQLGGDEKPTVEVKSLEEKSRTSRTRVHYHKFTRGKDISRYSAKDLSCIVGTGVALPKVCREVDSVEDSPNTLLTSKQISDDSEATPRQSRKKRKEAVSDNVVSLKKEENSETSCIEVVDENLINPADQPSKSIEEFGNDEVKPKKRSKKKKPLVEEIQAVSNAVSDTADVNVKIRRKRSAKKLKTDADENDISYDF